MQAIHSPEADGGNAVSVYTVGHSNRSLSEFLGLLAEYDIQLVADVRSSPHSARNPQYDAGALESSLEDAGIEYVHMAGLGGFRRPNPDSPKAGWRNERFRGYADHMQTSEFHHALDRLIAISSERRTAVMCAEAVPWRCHRSLIGDALVVRGINVEDILGPDSIRPHRLTPFAKVEGTAIFYPNAGGGV